MSESSPAQPFLSTKLLLSLLTVLQTLDANPHPVIQNTPETKRRASVAIILRVRPHYKHWPLPREAEHTWIGDREVQARLPAHESRLRDFFDQRWVKHGDPEVLLIRRAARKGDRWQSHIALPGGHREAADADDRAAAVREAWEEVGVDLGTSNAIPVGDLRQRFVTSVTGTRT